MFTKLDSTFSLDYVILNCLISLIHLIIFMDTDLLQVFALFCFRVLFGGGIGS